MYPLAEIGAGRLLACDFDLHRFVIDSAAMADEHDLFASSSWGIMDEVVNVALIRQGQCRSYSLAKRDGYACILSSPWAITPGPQRGEPRNTTTAPTYE